MSKTNREQAKLWKRMFGSEQRRTVIVIPRHYGKTAPRLRELAKKNGMPPPDERT